MSAMNQVNADLRKGVILAVPPGQTTNIIHTPEGYRIVKVISTEPAGQRD